jgi:hypothetical protein
VHRKREDGRGGFLSPESLAGWIFADIIIVLFIVGLGSAAAPEIPKTAPSPTAKPPPKPTPRIVGMRTSPSITYVNYDPSALLAAGAEAKPEQDRVCLGLRAATRAFRGNRAALVLIFGGGQDIGAAEAAATAVSKQLTCADGPLFRGTVSRPFWDGGLQAGSARLEIFMFTTS